MPPEKAQNPATVLGVGFMAAGGAILLADGGRARNVHLMSAGTVLLTAGMAGAWILYKGQ